MTPTLFGLSETVFLPPVRGESGGESLILTELAIRHHTFQKVAKLHQFRLLPSLERRGLGSGTEEMTIGDRGPESFRQMLQSPYVPPARSSGPRPAREG